MKCEFCGREKPSSITLQQNACQCCFGVYLKIRKVRPEDVDVAIMMLQKIKEREEEDE